MALRRALYRLPLSQPGAAPWTAANPLLGPLTAARLLSAQAGLSADQIEIQGVAREFARKEFMPFAATWDATSHFPIDALRAAAELGFGGIYVRDDVGGCGMGRLDAAVVFEALAYGDVSVTAYLTIHNMVCYMIDTFGSDEQRARLLPGLVRMDSLASYCLTEPGSGSDAASLRMSAVREGDHYVLSGEKAFISAGGVSDVYVVMARTGAPGPAGITAFIVEKGAEGLSFGANEKKMGWKAQPTAAVICDGVRVPLANRLGEEGQGFKMAMAALDGGRINIAACSLGGAQFCLDTARSYAQTRRQFGQPIGAFQNTAFSLVDMATQVQASRLLVRRAAAALDARAPSATLDAAMAKRFATDACTGVADRALQVLGGYGYLAEYHVERYLRDLRVHSILEGTNEVMRLIVARELDRLEPVA
eukprot:jgi/Tetstr1/458177/TSEL_044668.t1